MESWLKEGKKLLFAFSSPTMCSDITLEVYTGYQVLDFFCCATLGKTGLSTISAVDIELIQPIRWPREIAVPWECAASQQSFRELWETGTAFSKGLASRFPVFLAAASAVELTLEQTPQR